MKKCILVLFALLLVVGCGGVKKSPELVPIRVETMVVAESPVDDMHTYVGVVEEREATAVSFTAMGVIRRLLVHEGQTVAKGQLLAEMDETQARNLLQGAEAQMNQANDALRRYRMLYENGSLPEVQWVEIQSKVAQAASQLEVAKKNLSDCRLTAPVGGVVGKKLYGVGETVLPSQAVVNILDISSVKVKVSVPEAEVGHVTATTPTSIRVDAIGKEFQGGEIEKGVQADVLTHTYDVRVQVTNKERQLLPGMVASVSFMPSEQQQQAAILLPITAVQKGSDGSLFVWIVDQEQKAHRTNVEVGNTQGNSIAVVGGLEKGQRVVTDGYQKLSEGTNVVY